MENPTNNLLKKTAVSLALVFNLTACTTVPAPSESISPLETREEPQETKGFLQGILNARKRVERGDVLRETEEHKTSLISPVIGSEAEDVHHDDVTFSPSALEVE